MQSCASDFLTDGFRGRLTPSDREELERALAILRQSRKRGQFPPRLETSLDNSDASQWPSKVFWLSAGHQEFDRLIAAHDAATDRVIVLAGRAQVARRQAALIAGAHDFLSTGQVEPTELGARLLRLRTGSSLPDTISLNGQLLSLGDQDHPLSEREGQIMALLIEARGRFVTHGAMLALWGRHAHDMQYVRVAIRSLRRRIEPEHDMPRYLLSEPAVGYRLGPGWPPMTG